MRRLVVALVLVAACRFQPDPRDDEGRRIFRIGYMPNVTHAPALTGLATGRFAAALGDDVRLRALAFSAGPQVIEALFAGELDVAFVGPNPAINAYQRSRGRAVRVVAGSTSGGAALVVRAEVDGPADLVGSTLSSPALGNTQDVALRTWLHEQGLRTAEEGGTVRIKPAPPADILGLFQRGDLAGAWVPEPWVSRLIFEGGGKVLVDERTRWPGGEFPTTVVIASTVALEHRPELVRRFVAAHAAELRFIEERPREALALVRQRLLEELRTALSAGVLERAMANLHFTLDPMERQLRRVAEEARALGFIESASIEGLVDRAYLPPASTRARGGRRRPTGGTRPRGAVAQGRLRLELRRAPVTVSGAEPRWNRPSSPPANRARLPAPGGEDRTRSPASHAGQVGSSSSSPSGSWPPESGPGLPGSSLARSRCSIHLARSRSTGR